MSPVVTTTYALLLEGGDYLPTKDWWMTYCRAWQRLDEGWKNPAVAASPIVAILGCTAAGLYLHRCRKRIKHRVPA